MNALKRKLPSTNVILILLFVVLSVFVFRSFLHKRPSLVNTVENSYQVVKSRNKSSRYESFLVKEVVSNKTLTLMTDPLSSLSAGDIVLIDATTTDGVFFYPQISILERNQRKGIALFVFRIREFLITTIERMYPEPDASILLGVIFGIDRDLGVVLKERFRCAGLTHVLVASGYNVSLVVAYISPLILYTGRKWGSVITVCVIILFVLIAGAEPPIVRAMIMGIVPLVAILLHRQSHSVLWLVYSGIIMLVITPSILTSLSFWLSFSATFAILVIHPILLSRLEFVPDILREDLSTTVSVSLLTYPLILFTIGTFYPWGVIVNLLTLWIFPLLTIVGIAGTVFGVLFPFLQAIPVLLVSVLVHLATGIPSIFCR